MLNWANRVRLISSCQRLVSPVSTGTRGLANRLDPDQRSSRRAYSIILRAALRPYVAERNMKSRKALIPDVVSGQELVALKLSDTARDAAVLMDSNHVSSVLVVNAQGELCGIFTVRDVARRVVGGHLDPDTTPLSRVMTKNPKCAAATERPYMALQTMQDGGFRHLPVTDDGTSNGKLMGIVSRKSFYPEEKAMLEWENHLEQLIR